MSGIEVNDVTKVFGEIRALNHVTLQFENNKIYGLLGRNGAGKTTLLNSITQRIFIEEGDICIDGISIMKQESGLKNVYLMSEKTYYPETMKLQDVFAWTKRFYPKFDEIYAKKLTEQFELNCSSTVKSLSTGYNSILKLIIALSVNVDYVLLDEPVLGLDANHRDLFYRILLEKYSEHPCTIVISTHLIEEISNVIEEIVIIKKGAIICNESQEELLAKGYTLTGPKALVDGYVANKNVIGYDVIGGIKSAYILGTRERNIPDNIEVSKLDLQKLFIQLTNI